MFISTYKYNSKKILHINTDHIKFFEEFHEGTLITFTDGKELDIAASTKELCDILAAQEKKKTYVQTGTVNVKIVNPH